MHTEQSWTAHRRIADLENMTVTLNSTVVILRGHLKTAHVNIEELSNEKHKLRCVAFLVSAHFCI